MAVFVVDADAAIELARRGFQGEDGFDLYAPTLLRSQVLAILHSEVMASDGDSSSALTLAESACRLPDRLLGDAVLRKVAWAIANEHGWRDTFDAEYIALARLHADALVAGSESLRRRAEPIVEVRTVEELLRGPL